MNKSINYATYKRAEERLLIKMYQDGESLKKMAIVLNRSESSIGSKLKKLRDKGLKKRNNKASFPEWKKYEMKDRIKKASAKVVNLKMKYEQLTGEKYGE
jgi:transposase